MAAGPVTAVDFLSVPPVGMLDRPQAEEAQRLAAERAKQAVIDQLQRRDQEVRTHEAAHLAAAGPYAQGGPSYTYQVGPDGRLYAVGGGVNVDTSPGATPEETIRKARQLRAAALAPGDPSSQDYAVAAAAATMEQQAQADIQRTESEQEASGSDDSPINKSEGTQTGEADEAGQAISKPEDASPTPLDPDFLKAYIEQAAKSAQEPEAGESRPGIQPRRVFGAAPTQGDGTEPAASSPLDEDFLKPYSHSTANLRVGLLVDATG